MSSSIRQINIMKNYARILGVNHFREAGRRMNKILLLYYADILGKNICDVCNKEITFDNLTMNHIKSWRRCWKREGNANLFWDINNISLRHRGCNTVDSNQWDQNIEMEYPKEHECNQGIKSKEKRIQANFDNDLLGMTLGKANERLFKKLLFEWCCKANKNYCSVCKKPVLDIKKWTIEHNIPWLSGSNDKEKNFLYFDINNLLISHLRCNIVKSKVGKGKSKYLGVSRYIDKSRGREEWIAKITAYGKIMSVRYSDSEEECAEAYDIAVLKYCNGEGILNFPEKIDKYLEIIKSGWREKKEKPTCKICSELSLWKGYCKKHYYELCGGKEKRKQKYIKSLEDKRVKI